MGSVAKVFTAILLPLVCWLAVGCGSSDIHDGPNSTKGGEFAIYLPAEDLSVDDSMELSRIELFEEPILFLADIISYAAETHVIELVPSSADRLAQLDLPGKPFVVSVDRQPIYHGAFMAAYMSRSYDGVVILWPSMEGKGRTIRIQLGYPGPDFFVGEDPRSDSRIMDSIRQAGKLK